MAIKQGDTVVLEYTGKLESGEVFDTSRHGDHSHPITFEVGSGQVIKGFEEGVVGLGKGESKEITIAPEDAYGMPRDDLSQEVPKSALPKDMEAQEGMVLALQGPNGQQVPAKVAQVKDETVVIDLNHPLAGKTLIFDVEVVDVNPEKTE